MANFFYIYEDFGVNRRLKGMYVTQDKADSEAAGDISLTANQGSVDIPNHVYVGWVWDTTEAKWREPEFSDLSVLKQLKTAAMARRLRTCSLAEALKEHEHYFSAPDYDLAKDLIAYSLWGDRAVFMSVDLGEGDKLSWAFASTSGPADLDLTTPDLEIADMFIGIVHLWSPEILANAHPAERILFVSTVSPYENFNLSEAKVATKELTTLADDPLTAAEIAKIATGAWIDDITV